MMDRGMDIWMEVCRHGKMGRWLDGWMVYIIGYKNLCYTNKYLPLFKINKNNHL
jgi:hypothetical protein